MPDLIALDKTCSACPEQYEGMTACGQHVYLRHRHGYGSVSIGPTLDAAIGAGWPWGDTRGRFLLVWQDEDWDGQLRPGALPHVLYLAGLDPTAEVEQNLATSPDADDFIEAAAELGIHLIRRPNTKEQESTDA